ncbi:class I SAM-dependent methyltransferase [Frigidibacter sp. ROC022]|uniref:class I SAM-dependent methyltransferase n=1 Tax=Frigidibacter sp. ROC022 TaxID=2971796 RepID=UPI00215A7D57|nr:class I SAM-dependent methyltransferase [Frigidibacter sp. ROC022]MCR8723348.1 class I SAM-dependent methyltransferase [Frigidibacter sp. ROC022]
MRLAVFEALAPICPRCLHQLGRASPITIATREEMRAGDLWHGVLTCSNPECWLEFPVIDGVPVITRDPAASLQSLGFQALCRDDLPPALESILGDAAGTGSDYDTRRSHMSLYCGSQYDDWTGSGRASSCAGTVAAGLGLMADHPAPPDGPALDLGCGTGRAAWEIARATGRVTLGADLSLTFLRFAQKLLVEGRASFPQRRIGTVYDRVEVTMPESHAGMPVDFWALDALALPFVEGAFALGTMINVVDCISGPTEALIEAGRVMADGAGLLVTTPYDWAPNVTAPQGWFGGHSQRAAHQGRGEPVLKATLERSGFDTLAEVAELPWVLRPHARSEMTYQMHMVLASRAARAAATA